MEEVIRFENAGKTFFIEKGRTKRVLENISFSVVKGERLGIVGESGCGKTTLARILTCLDTATEGKVIVEGQDTSVLKGEALRNFRKKVQMIFQDPSSVFSPRMKIGHFLMEPWVNFEKIRRKSAVKKALEALSSVGLEGTYFNRYPHELSGGELQRVCIARAVAVSPSILVCDEATSALDVSIQKKILTLLSECQKKADFTNILITHDLALAEHFCDRVVVMRSGKLVEILEARHLKRNAKEEYTRKLLDSVYSLKK